MSRPRISDYKRRLWKKHPMLSPGVSFTPLQRRAIQAMIENDELWLAQHTILGWLRLAFEGPRTVARQRGRRKILRAA